MQKYHKNSNKGFTLIELLVVVAIIAILALIVMLAINPVEMARRSRDSRRLSDLGTLRKSIDLALADGKTLPDTAGWVNLDSSTSVTAFPIAGGADISKYLSVVPTDPQYDTAGTLQLANGDCATVQTGVNKNTMRYQIDSDGSVYVLRAKIESLDNCKALSQDGGPGANLYEIGTAPSLIVP